MKRRQVTYQVMVLVFGLPPAAAWAGDGAAARIDFARDVRPILAGHCFRCHGAKKQEGGLRLDVRRRAFQGGDAGPAIVAKSGPRSLLLQRVTAKDDDRRMPPSAPHLTQQHIHTLKMWIEEGAIWPDELAGKEDYESHWSFRPVRRPAVPVVKSQVRHPIDAFVLAGLEAKGLTLAKEAPRPTLVRRLHLDLIGLPPTPAEVDAFLKDDRPDAYERVVDRLLASPHFGERWGRHWLDLARFGESDGYENDNLRPHAWRYRDWVVEAFNRDMPFDQFTIEQLAGDLLPKATTEQQIAAGLHRHTLWNSAASADKEEFRTLAIKDRADTTAAAWMGLTLGCAKCHSHKYDPISQREYYQLYAFFNNTNHHDVAVSGGQVQTLKAAQRVTHIHMRGNFQQKGEEVKPATPAFLPPLKARAAIPDRLDLAHWLVDPKQPLAARVAANRLWQHLFGQGLVPTPENFGRNGAPPTHPELLDWLASEFIQHQGKPKALIRTIVLSKTYRQSAALRGDLAKLDPANRLLGRQQRFRVEAEIVRDLALSASGLLNPKLGGPSIVPPFPEGFLGFSFGAESLRLPIGDAHRRSIYIHVQRTLTHPFLAAFEVADGNQPCLRRDRSTTAIQALTLLNDPIYLECAKALAKRVRQAQPETRDRLRLAFRLCLAREPADKELTILNDLVETQTRLKASDDAIWLGVARTLLNLEEFITRE